MNASLCIFLAATLGVAGCGDKQPAAKSKPDRKIVMPAMAGGSTGAEGKADHGPPPPPGVAAPVNHDAVFLKAGEKYADGRDVGLTTINEALKQYIEDTGLAPSHVEDLVKVGRLARVPIPPEGMRYVINAEKKTAEILPK